MKKNFPVFTLSLLALALAGPALSAQPVNLAQQPFSVLSAPAVHVLSATGTHDTYTTSVRQTGHHQDARHVTHIRIQQTFSGIPVWGTDAVVHVPASTGSVSFTTLMAHPAPGISMNGIFYKNIGADLPLSAEKVLSREYAAAALQQALTLFRQGSGATFSITDTATEPMVFVDEKNRAHWVFKIRFSAQASHHAPVMPVLLMDAVTHEIYKQWNNLQTGEVTGGGLGGNPRMGKLIYDGLTTHLASFTVSRDAKTSTCSLQNTEVKVEDRDNKDKISTFACAAPDKNHNNTYWDDAQNKRNEGYSPDNDALFIGHVVQKLYHEWYGIPALVDDDGSPMQLVMRVHDIWMSNNAYWDGRAMTFGDGGSKYYPFTILNIGAHEISHGFTQQHSDLVYKGQSGGLNESFSDMAGAAANYYAYGKNNWQLGLEIVKDTAGTPFRFMDKPSKDCGGEAPGHFCSIDNASQYAKGQDLYCDWLKDPFCMNPKVGPLDVHHSSGVFNRAFYLLATTAGWNTHKAFDVMVKANQDYWTSTTTFQEAACGVLKATKDLKYDTAAVKNALKKVGLSSSSC